MCGIAGLWGGNEQPDQLHRDLQAMGLRLKHRGPDDSDIFVDANSSLGFVHQRLSILDLSPQGRQPMSSASGRYIICYNGEIYNSPELREECSRNGYPFKGRSDTEVILALCEQKGVRETPQFLKGMFAYALWDRQEKQLWLFRDRVGIKPLYWGQNKGKLAFCSELHALQEVSNINLEYHLDSAALFIRHNYIPAPHTIYKGFYKLMPGTGICLQGPTSNTQEQSFHYWNAVEMVQHSSTSPFKGSFEEAVDELEIKLKHSVQSHMLSDVPLGAFLSGGIDSSLVVALMRQKSGQKIKSFSIGFREEGYDEASHAKKVAEHLGTEHTELYLEANEVIEEIPNILQLCDEPFADSSQIPTWFVSKLAKEQVTVSLSGDGGDELFSGYVRYLWGESIWNKLKKMPNISKSVLQKGIHLLKPETWETLGRKFESFLPSSMHQVHLGDKLYRLAEVAQAQSPGELYRDIVSHERLPESWIPGAQAAPTLLDDDRCWKARPHFIESMMLLDLLTYLPDDILTKVDRASMGHSLEARVPLLDHEIIEFAWSLPLEYKNEGASGKKVLREVLYRHVPKELIDRPKMGFGIPVGAWLRTRLRDWAEDLLSEQKLKDFGLLNVQQVRQKWQQHLSGERNWQYTLWNFIVLQHWLSTHSK